MARIASQAKGGYYPTPPKQMSLALERIRVDEGSTVNLLDPAAGTGLALKRPCTSEADTRGKRVEYTGNYIKSSS